MPETTPLIKAALNLRVGAGFDVYDCTAAERNCVAYATRRRLKNPAEQDSILPYENFISIR